MASEVVLVVGAGPVGLTMAAELARYGVPVRIIDKAATRTDKSKAIAIWPRTLELMDRLGCTPAFLEAGFKVRAANMIGGGKQVAHVRLDSVATRYPFALMLPQSDTERLLEERLNALGVRVEREVELTHFTQDEAQVTATLRRVDGQEETAHVAWLIGCDGAHSAVRHGLNMAFAGDTLASNWVLADLQLAGLATPPDELDIHLHAQGVLLLFPLGSGRFRLIADVSSSEPGATQAAPSLEDVQTIIDQRGPGGVQASHARWLGCFTINERKVENYRAGRAFVAGDAAHVHSPAGGQGMNIGMQDAFNLAWKLALVSSGAATQTLLDSYSAERSEVARQVLLDAGRLTTLGTLKGGITQAIRNQAMSLVFGLSAAQRAMTNKLSELSVAYPNSPLTRAAKHVDAGPVAGARVPPSDAGTVLGSGNRPLFSLFAPASAESAALIARHRALLEPELRAPFSDDAIWLTRPDGYVALTASSDAWSEIDGYFERLARA